MSSTEITKATIAGFPAHVTEAAGGRPPLLFLHGAFVTHESFDGLQLELARLGWGGVSFSRRGRHGVGPALARGVTIDDYLADTLAVIDTMKEMPVLVGHSLGGLIAQKVAEMGKCHAAVLLAPAPAAMLTAQAVALPSYLPMFPKILAGKPLLPPPGTCSRIVLNRVPAEYHQAVHGSLVHESGKVYREMIFGSYKVDAGKVKCPMLAMGAEEDRIVSPGLVAWTAKRYGAELKMYKDRAHLFFAEPGWEPVAADMAAWLNRNATAAVSKLKAA